MVRAGSRGVLTLFTLLVSLVLAGATTPFDAITSPSVAHLANDPIVPDAPETVDLFIAGDTSLRVDFTPPVSDGGSQVTSYKVEWDTEPGLREVRVRDSHVPASV